MNTLMALMTDFMVIKPVGVAHLRRYTPAHSANAEPTVVTRQNEPNRGLSRLGQQAMSV